MSTGPHLTKFDLTGRVALVTGAGIGIGRATALALASAGAMVGVHYNSSASEARQTLDEIVGQRAQGFILQGDFTHEEQADRFVDQLVEQAGRLDILVNSVQTGGSGGAGPYAASKGALQVMPRTLFLASDASSFITGAVIDINGGRFLR